MVRITQELVLIGGGHSHVQLLRAWIMRPIAGVRLTLVVDEPVAMYSGMVPAIVAGQVPVQAAEIDLIPLARRAGVRVVLAACTGIDVVSKHVQIHGRPDLPWDVASLDVGSTVRGRDLPGVQSHSVATRPIALLPGRMDGVLAQAQVLAELEHDPRALEVVVVGGGAAGFELAACSHARITAETGIAPKITLVFGRPQLLHGSSAALIRQVERAAAQRGMTLRPSCEVAAVEADAVVLQDGERISCDAVIWAAGAAAHPWLAACGLPCDGRGYVRVGTDLRVNGYSDLFAAGDCAVVAGYESTPRAGVYAVRAGPILDANIRLRLSDHGRLTQWQPQRDFLALLNLGDGSAIGGKWQMSWSGTQVYALKNRIDQGFMRKFQALLEDGQPSTDVPSMPAMDAMICGGCAAKVGQDVLTRALGRLPPRADPNVLLGVTAGDDVAVTRLPGGGALISTVDVFRGFADDPWLMGRVAAFNALSDSWVAGGQPTAALAIVAIADREPGGGEEALYQLLAGARSVFDAHDISLVGGHTTTAPELLVGFSIFGAVADVDTLQAGSLAQPDHVLVLSKALGTGVVLHADGAARAPGRVLRATYAAMQRSNAAPARIVRAHGASGVTDVTGFGLAVHLGGLLRRAGCAADLQLDALPLLPGVAALLSRGERSTLHPTNKRASQGIQLDPRAAQHPSLDILFDPQTAGGVLAALPPARVAPCLEALRQAGCGDATVIGVVKSGKSGEIAVFAG